jgi:acetyl-CoA acetyltransferase
MVSVAPREWAAKNPRATFKDPITIVNVFASFDFVERRRADGSEDPQHQTMQLPHSHRMLVCWCW